MKHLPDLHKAAENILLHPFETDQRSDGIIFLLDRLIAEEFMEILLLCSHDYGFGAQRLLRGMYERLVASLYIELDPVQADRLMEFGQIQRLKYANLRRDIHKVEVLSAQERDELEKECKALASKFEVELCKTCNTHRPGFSWSPLDLRSMARKAGNQLEVLYIDCAFAPTMQLHNTEYALRTRVRWGENTVSFIEGPQPEMADEVMADAHLLLFMTLDHHNNHFHVGQDEVIKQLGQSLEHCWDSRPSATTPPGSG